MRAVQICGYHHSGKTTVARELIRRLKIAGYSVASIKDIHFAGFEMDQPNTNTYHHKLAGADPVIARGEKETDFLYNHKMELFEITDKLTADWLVVEGFHDVPLPKIVCGKTEKEIDDFFDRRTFAISGVVANIQNSYRGLRVFNSLDPEQADELWQLTLTKVFPMLPYIDENCCLQCGLTCSEMVAAIIQGEKSDKDCMINKTDIQLKIDGRRIPVAPSVQQALKNNVLAVVRELKDWQENQRIEITIHDKK